MACGNKLEGVAVLLRLRYENRHPVRMMRMDQRQVKDEVHCEMDGDDVKERVGLLEDDALYEREEEDERRTPEARKAKFIEKRREEYRLGQVRPKKRHPAPETPKHDTDEEQLVPNTKAVRPDEEPCQKTHARLNRPVQIRARPKVRRQQEVREYRSEDDVCDLFFEPPAAVMETEADKLLTVDVMRDAVRHGDR